MVARPQIPLLRPEALGTYSFEDTFTRHKMYFDLIPYIICIRDSAPGFADASCASMINCLLHFRQNLHVQIYEDGENSERHFYYGSKKGKLSASKNKAQIELIHEIYSSYKYRSINLRRPGSADLTDEQLVDLEELIFKRMNPAVLKDQLFPPDAAERSAFLAFCELTRDLFYFKTLPDENVHPWTFRASGRRMGFRREELKITKVFVVQVASSMIKVDPRWSAVKDKSGSLNYEKMDDIIKKYSPIAPILYSINRMGWPSDIWANKFYLDFDRFATFYTDMYGILTSEQVFGHHNERSFTKENIYWLDLTNWPVTKAPPPEIKQELVFAIKQVST